MTRDRAVASEWLTRFEGAGLDGVIAKPEHGTYKPGKRAMFKVKHARTADCVVAGFRWHKSGAGTVGSLLLGLYDGERTLQHVGVTSAFTMATRKQLAQELAPLREGAVAEHPWRDWAGAGDGGVARMPGGGSRWSAGKDLSWEPLRIERVCEVKYDHLQGRRFRHATMFLRWRPDKRPGDCRYDQLEVTAPYELEKVFSRRSRVTRPRVFRRHPDRASPEPVGAHRARAAGSSGCASRCDTGRASHRRARRRAPGTPPRRGDAPASARVPRARPPSVARVRSRSADVAAFAGVTAATREGSPACFLVMRRPRRVAQAVTLMTRRQLEQAHQRARVQIDGGVPIAELGEARAASWRA